MMIDAPTVALPSDNNYDIPVLRLDRQGGIEHPFVPWGSVARSNKMTGTWHFYVDDTRFNALSKAPLQVVSSGCKQLIELNVSLFDHTPAAYAYWATYRKRYAARTWQDAGLDVLVDLCVPERFARINLLGVPRGWKSYATRGFSGRPYDVEREYGVAVEHGGDDARLVVYGGGEPVRKLCQTLPNAIFVEQFQEARRVKNG
jgi:Domain of unknown function (DUF4417)